MNNDKFLLSILIAFIFAWFTPMVYDGFYQTSARLKKLEAAITCVQQPQERHSFKTTANDSTFKYPLATFTDGDTLTVFKDRCRVILIK
jgi:hypothetical protein